MLIHYYIGLVISAVANNLLAVMFLAGLLTGTPTFFSGMFHTQTITYTAIYTAHEYGQL